MNYATVILIERFIGVLYLILGLSLVIRTAMWKELTIQFANSVSSYKTINSGLIALMLGLFIVINHNIWIWSPEVIVTILGWIVLIKGILLINFPRTLRNFLPKEENLSKIIFAKGLILIILAAIIINHSYIYLRMYTASTYSIY